MTGQNYSWCLTSKQESDPANHQTRLAGVLILIYHKGNHEVEKSNFLMGINYFMSSVITKSNNHSH